MICGRQAGKSTTLALIAVYLALFEKWPLRPGEQGRIIVIATNRDQAGVIFGYIKTLLTTQPMFEGKITRMTSDAVDLNNGIGIEIHTANFRSVRGYKIVAALCDEIAFWANEEGAANPDHEILNAIRPGMITVPKSMFLFASSPFEQRGELYDAHQKYYGQDDAPALVWRAPTRAMNPAIPQSAIDAAYARDPLWARSEYGAEFRVDRADAFLTRGAVEACIVSDRYALPFCSHFSYSAFVDPSGGSGSDSMTLGICHRDGDVVVLDCLRERAPEFSPEAVVNEFAQVMRSYCVGSVTGDGYGGDFVRERFAEHRIFYDSSAKPKNELYLELLARINSRQIELLDNDTLKTQLLGLTRKSGRVRDVVDHPSGAHDDLANAVAGVAACAHEPIRML